MQVKILGSACSKCKTLERKLRELNDQHQLDLDIQKITDFDEMIKYGIMMTPGLVINEEVKSVGIVPKTDQLLEWLKK